MHPPPPSAAAAIVERRAGRDDEAEVRGIFVAGEIKYTWMRQMCGVLLFFLIFVAGEITSVFWREHQCFGGKRREAYKFGGK